MNKRVKRLLSLVLCLLMFVSVAQPAFAVGTIAPVDDGMDREIGEDEVRPFGDLVIDEEAEEEFFTLKAEDEETGLRVEVDSPYGALPTLAELKIERVDVEDVREVIEEAAGEEKDILMAVDISFWMDGVELQPEDPVRVIIAAPELEGVENMSLIHVPDMDAPETVDLIDRDDLAFELGTDEICFTADSFSVYAVVDEGTIDDQSRLTINFINTHLGGSEADQIVATVYVKNSDDMTAIEKIVYDPGIGEEFDPEDPDEKNLMFRGWSIDAADANPQPDPTAEDPDPDPIPYGANYNSSTKSYSIEGLREYLVDLEIAEGQVLNVYAMLFRKCNVTYLGQDPDVSLGSFAVLRTLTEESVSYEVNMLYTPDESDENFDGWMIFDPNEKGNIVSASYNGVEIAKPFKAASEEDPTLFPNTTILELSGDLTLSVSTPKGHWLIFNENGKGATYNAPMFIKADDPIVKPVLAQDENMTRNGYTFGGWYTDKDCTAGNEFVFSGKLTENKTIYAKWTVNNTAPYTVVIWKQNIDLDGYDFAESVSLSGSTNATINTVNARGGDPGQDSAYVRITGRPGGQDVKYDGFHLQAIEATNDFKIAPEGNTIVNVYFDRTTYTLTFQDYTYTQNRNGDYVYWPGGYYRAGNYPYTYYYFPEGYYSRNNNYYTNEGNYGEGPSPVNGVGNNTNQTYYTRNANGTYTSHTYRAYRYNRSNNRTTVKTITAVYEQNIVDQFPIVDSNGMTYDDGQRWEPVGSTTFTRVILTWELMPNENVTFYMNPGTKRPLKTMNYYVEALPTDTNTVTYNGVRYVLYNTIVARYNMVTEAEDFFDIKGFGKTGTDPAFNDNGIALNDSSNDGTINMYYYRKSFTIHYMDGAYFDGDDKPVDEISKGDLGNSPLELYNSDITSYNKGGEDHFAPTRAGYVFEGWYLDDSCSTPAVFSKMPDGGITVFAKWRQVQFRVFLHPNAGDSDATADQSLSWGKDEQGNEVAQAMNFRKSEGELVSLPTGTRDAYDFVGWYTDPEFEHPFNADVVTLTTATVTTPYDKTVDMTDNAATFTNDDGKVENVPINRWGYLDDAGINKDVDRFWILTKLDLFGKWKAKLEGAEGIGVIYDVGEGSGQITDPMLYDDNSKAIAQQASLPPAVGEGERELMFLYWIVQKWNGSAYEDTSVSVYPADNFIVHVEDARKEPVMENGVQATDDAGNKLYTYTIQLRAIYGPKDAPTPTHITWYANNNTGDFENSADVAINAPIEIPMPAADMNRADDVVYIGWDKLVWEDHVFLGWARVDESTLNGETPAEHDKMLDLGEADLFLKYVADDSDLGYHFEAQLPKTANGGDGTHDYNAPIALRGGENETEWKKVNYVAADEFSPYHAMYAVWAKVFYVYHSATGNVERVVIDTKATPTVDLASRTSDGFLYGGIYSSFSGVGSGFDVKSVSNYTVMAEDAIGTLETQAAKGWYSEGKDSGATTYDTAANIETITWDTATAYTDKDTFGNGLNVKPEAGAVYYIKEVPASMYLQPYLHYTYHKDTDLISTAWLISDFDDSAYIETGFVIIDANNKANVCSSLTVQNKVGGASIMLTPALIFSAKGVTSGYLSYLEVISGGQQTLLHTGDRVVQYWVTPDGLIVTGTAARTYAELTDRTQVKAGANETEVESTIAVFANS